MDSGSSVKLRHMVFVSIFASLISAGAQFSIPLPLIPLTLQTFFVLLAAIFLGSKWGSLSVLIYLVLGIIGFPVFSAGSSGLGVLLGPTGGYLYGFIFASLIVGTASDKIFERFESVSLYPLILIFSFCFLGSLIILTIGSLHLAMAASLPLKTAFFSGFVPFVAGDIAKSVGVSAVMAVTYQKRLAK